MGLQHSLVLSSAPLCYGTGTSSWAVGPPWAATSSRSLRLPATTPDSVLSAPGPSQVSCWAADTSGPASSMSPSTRLCPTISATSGSGACGGSTTVPWRSPPLATDGTSHPRRSPRIAASEEPCFLSMLHKAALLKKHKLEGGRLRASMHPAAASVHPAAFPQEILEVAASSTDHISLSDLKILGAACDVPDEMLSSLDDIDPVADFCSAVGAPLEASPVP